MCAYPRERLGRVVTAKQRPALVVWLPRRKTGIGFYYKKKASLGCVPTLEKGWAGFLYQSEERVAQDKD